MSDLLENALYEWEGGERRVRAASAHERAGLERAVGAVLDELRRRLGSSFSVEELAALYSLGVEWAEAVAERESPLGGASVSVDAAFGRYALKARDFAGGGRARA